MKDQGSFSHHIVDYEAINKLKPKDFLLAPMEFQHQTKVIHNTLFQVLSQYFGKKLCKKRIIINGVQLPKYKKWPLPLKKMQCAKEKADILLLSTLPYDVAKINETIDIFRKLI